MNLLEYKALCQEWNYEKNDSLPSSYSHGSNKKVWWRCDKGHEWNAFIYNRTSGKGCPYCSGRKVLSGFNDLKTRKPELCKEWSAKNDINPSKISWCTGRKAWWICSKGHEWEDHISKRSTERHGCPYCSGRRVLPGYNDLKTTHPEMCLWWSKKNDISPESVSRGSSKRILWECSIGHEWHSKINNRTSGRGCPYCSNKKILKGFNDLLTKEPELGKEWSSKNQIKPTEVARLSNKKVWWKCLKGHEWKAQINNRVQFQYGCPECSLGQQTSNVEKALEEGLSKYFNIADKKIVNIGKKRYYIDILLDEDIVIEYDGYYWHKSKVENDRVKTEQLEGCGYRVIRVRENPLTQITENDLVVSGSYNNATLNYYIESFLSSLISKIKSVKTLKDF